MVNSSAAALFCQLHGAQLINYTDIVGIIEIAMNAMSCESSQYKLDDASSKTQSIYSLETHKRCSVRNRL